MRLRRYRNARPTGCASAARAWYATGFCLCLVSFLNAFGSSSDSQNIYDWMATAPLVVAGRVAADDLRYVELEAVGVARGNLTVGSRIAVNLRSANRDRQPNTDATRLEQGATYLLLLSPNAKSKSGATPRFDLVRGVGGVRPIPQEGVEAYLEGIVRLAEIQALHDDEQAWNALRSLLDDPNPLLVQTSLDLLLRYARGAPADSARVRPLLDHPQAQIRELAARFLGGVLVLPGAADPAEREAVFGELAARARRDASVNVRIAATTSAAATKVAGVDDLLREIARQDPDQSVRYAAERTLYERRNDPPSPKPN